MLWYKYDDMNIYIYIIYLAVEKRPNVASASIAQAFVIFTCEWYSGRKR